MAGSDRSISVDAIRGLIIFTMVFVNDLASVRAAPWWMKHFSPGNASGMTFVDLVFPAFLFIVGMSVPLAFESRARRGERLAVTMLHAVLRTLQLLFIGVLMVNSSRYITQFGIRPRWWELSMYLCAVLAFLAPPSAPRRSRFAAIVAKAIGFVGLIALAAIFRTSEGQWLRPAWWGILGLIGWAYLVCCTVWIASFNRRWLLFVYAAALLSLFILDRRGAFDGWWIDKWVDIGSTLGTHACIAVLGAALGSILRSDSTVISPRQRLTFAGSMIAACAVAALLLHRPWGINKNAATPAWGLWASAATTVLWLVLYATIDVIRRRRWARPFAAAGASALLIYLLHPILYNVIELAGWNAYWNLGQSTALIGIARSLTCTVFLCAIAVVLTKNGARLKL